MAMKGAVCKRIYDEVVAENESLKEQLHSLQKSNKQKTKIIRKLREQLPLEIKYKEQQSLYAQSPTKYEKNTVYYDFNENSLYYTIEAEKPVSIYWDKDDLPMDRFMSEHIGTYYPDFTKDAILDWTFIKPIKDKFWKKGEEMWFRTKSNADGYFNIWFYPKHSRVGCNYITKQGFLYCDMRHHEVLTIPCKYNDEVEELVDEENTCDFCENPKKHLVKRDAGYDEWTCEKCYKEQYPDEE